MKSSLQLIDAIVTLVAVQHAVQLSMAPNHYPTPAERALATALVVQLSVISILQRVVFIQLLAGVLAVANRVEPSLVARWALAVAYPFDMGGEVQPKLHLLHPRDKFRLIEVCFT